MQRVQLFGMNIDRVTMRQAIEQVYYWAQSPFEKCHYVVTPNVDHTVLFQQHEGLRAAYRDADLVTADGHPVVVASKLVGRPLPERVPGSDLVPKLFDHVSSRAPLRVFLLGAAPGVGMRAAERMKAKWPNVITVGCYSPPIGFEKDNRENDGIISAINKSDADLLIIGLGAPKQELWIHRHAPALKTKVALCVGATIDFLAGEKRRAPRWIQSVGMEWMHRMCSEPKRLMKRYAKDAWIFPQLVIRQMIMPNSFTF